MANNKFVSVATIQERFNLTNFTPELNLEEAQVTVADVNRPALQLHGFYEHFDSSRIQVIGNVEAAYLNKKTDEEKAESFAQLLTYDIPCVIFCRGEKPGEILLKEAVKANVPVLGTDRATSEFMSALIYSLNKDFAPYTTIHGVLVDVYGEGLLITGESGIGKSEAALELIRRGHRLVSDDVVEIRRPNNERLYGRAPSITQYLIELRGIGIIDVKSLYGVEAVKDEQRIDLVIKLEDWSKEKEYDRLGMTDEYMNILGIDVTCHSLPIRPGRNLAIICEAAAVNHRQKKMGYNAAEELYRRVQNNING
ncbi:MULTISPECIES: HPr(Ser) kinase/phosphatase [Pseudobutyrivibrio]|uniref:HPr kinase/phosphorylase n=2 Tax=Pseudobutyrivibrio ruminis TaxID=46206 RepID=A0A1H7KM44_9FIRM|nr:MULTISPECIES: HPr(Ser) kinase/phosphatase [Pseudobutyrivibrio]MBE5914596.1 HPr(Ser) kinase/phosphatase [Pseudobutyrivibrio ruminis]SEK87869.1 Hpr(Ser) kinase/phosphatase [Pseudobutyrivibrio ruminis]SFO58814.1 Hpr(Ser) kinase/phosphatase [Pseudobutyrivibrio sp. JW11]SOC15030.1 Hpr(Ser) kinase/phosphatase [Pseudobutyrivibrio ruminis DSM 9787]